MDLERLGRRVKSTRLQAGMSKEAAARAAKMSSITWKRIEDGEPVRDVSLAAAITLLELQGHPDTQGAVADVRRDLPRPGDEDLEDVLNGITSADLARELQRRLEAQDVPADLAARHTGRVGGAERARSSQDEDAERPGV